MEFMLFCCVFWNERNVEIVNYRDDESLYENKCDFVDENSNDIIFWF